MDISKIATPPSIGPPKQSQLTSIGHGPPPSKNLLNIRNWTQLPTATIRSKSSYHQGNLPRCTSTNTRPPPLGIGSIVTVAMSREMALQAREELMAKDCGARECLRTPMKSMGALAIAIYHPAVILQRKTSRNQDKAAFALLTNNHGRIVGDPLLGKTPTVRSRWHHGI